MTKRKQKTVKSDPGFIPCSARALPESMAIEAAATAVRINPMNAPVIAADLPRASIAMITGKYWGTGGVNLTVSFMENVAQNLKERILSHMNAWGKYCNVKFQLVQTGGKVRITLQQDGYWSYLGTDVSHIPANEPTMCLQGFSMSTPESEYLRVVRHEVGHTLGCPHEHMRQQIVARLNRAKTIAWGRRVLGWSQQMVEQQILTPLSERSIRGTPEADDNSIMCYQLPGDITNDGQPIPGGNDINATDGQFMGTLYPLPNQPPPPPPPPPTGGGSGTCSMAYAGCSVAIYPDIRQVKVQTPTDWSTVRDI